MDVMTDLETLGLTPNAKLLSIGACRFDITTLSTREELSLDSFYVNIDKGSYSETADGLFSESDSTLKFWMEQPVQAQVVLLSNQISWFAAIDKYFDWLGASSKSMWANSPSFDLEMLKYHARVGGNAKRLWNFWEERDFRTFKALHLAKFGAVAQSIEGIKHYALDDAINQAYDAQRFYARLVLGQDLKENGKPSREFIDSTIAGARW